MAESDETKQERRPFEWTDAREKAALLVYADDLTDDQISEAVGIARSTLWIWRKQPEFIARIEELSADFRARIRRKGIAIMENRVAALQDRQRRMDQVIRERGENPEMQHVPGGTTGLMVHNVKAIGSGETAERVDLYEVDTALLAEMRATEKQAAQELGQWTEKSAVDGSMNVKTYQIVSPDDWDKSEPKTS